MEEVDVGGRPSKVDPGNQADHYGQYRQVNPLVRLRFLQEQLNDAIDAAIDNAETWKTSPKSKGEYLYAIQAGTTHLCEIVRSAMGISAIFMSMHPNPRKLL